jgi:serine/threonine protein kinase
VSDDDVPQIAPGSILLDKYRAESVIGVGGMGIVVSATHMQLGTHVAIKFLLSKFATSTEAAQRFVREAKAASRIGSEHIARVLDTGTSPELGPFIVMEYIEGGDLSRHLKNGHVFQVGEAIDFIVQACEALAHAHAAGIVHRDVKPANLFLGTRADGLPIVKVLDFGISKVAEDSGDMNMTKTTAILGSGYYMSPEQMRSSKNVDHRTDIYGLGITFYELLTRTVPFMAETFADLAIKVAVDPPDPISRHRSDVPQGLADAIAKAYAKKPDERYQNVGEMVLALAPWAAVETLPMIESIQRLTGAPAVRLQSIPPGRYSTPPPAAGGNVSLPAPARLPSLPPPYLGGPVSQSPASQSTSGLRPGEGSAPALAMTTATSSSKTLVGLVLGLAVVIGVGVGAGLYVRGAAQPTVASTTPPEPKASEAPPPASASAPVVPTIEPVPEASSAPAPSASAAPSASVPLVAAPPRPKPPRTATPSAAPSPPKLCEVFNPDKGLREIVPCK